MSSVGLKDNVVLTGTVTISDSSVDLAGAGTKFLIEVDEGDYIGVSGYKYQVANVTSNVLLSLTSFGQVSSAGESAYVQQGPKYVGNVALEDNVYTIQRIVGVDANEAQVPSNRAKNLKTPGWVHHQEYTGGHGQTRYKSEVLVAMSKNFDAANISDWDDDATLLDYLLYFTQQPVDKNVAANANVTLHSTVLSQPAGATVTYQWYQSPNNLVFAALTDVGVYTGTTTNTLQIANVANLDANFFKVTASAVGVADANTSATIEITHL